MSDTAQVINQLAKGGAVSLLEIVSMTTGLPISDRIGVRAFGKHLRLTYGSNEHRIQFDNAQSFPTVQQTAWLAESFDSQFDVVFIDPWHSIQDSLRLMKAGLRAVRPEGTLIIHDCHPLDPELRKATPESALVPWCGETWKVWHHLTSFLSPVISWRTINVDHGIGVLIKPRAKHLQRRLFKTIDRLSEQPEVWRSLIEWQPNPSQLRLTDSVTVSDMMSA
ncbi:MAG: hypothetical protein ACKOJ9_07500 [Actinomycetota bacterium]